MKNRAKSFLAKQKIAVGVIAVVAVVIVGYFSTLVLQENPMLGDFIEGEHYELIENPRRVRGDQIEIMEFFSYACVHCYNFDPTLEDWVETKGDTIKFVRTPAVANDLWRILGRNYYTMETLDLLEEYHLPFFREVHEVRRNFSTPERLADYFESQGVPRADYEKTFNSSDVMRKVSDADKMARRLQVASVPTIVVHGKYAVKVTRAVGISRMLEVMDYLIEKETTQVESGNNS
jgi:protein dithiol oxidoreductase (disulfide-forming)